MAFCAINGFSLNSCREEATLIWHFREHYVMCSYPAFSLYFLFFFFFFFTKELLFFCEFESAIVYIDETTTHVSSITAVVIWNVLFIF